MNDWHGLVVSNFCTSQPETRWTVSTRICRGRRRLRRRPTSAKSRPTSHGPGLERSCELYINEVM